MSRTRSATLSGAGDWESLQRKIFSRWCAQRLAQHEIVIKDIVDDMTATVLIHLLEILADKQFTAWKKIKSNPKMRPQAIDSMAQAHKFAFETCGINMKQSLWPSVEQLVDKDHRPIMGMVWAIMQTYMKFDDEEDGAAGMSAEDALLMWVQSCLSPYADLKVTDFKKSWANGMAYCALIHAHRPKLIPDFASLNPGEAAVNIQTALDAATRYWDMEQYLDIAEVLQLDARGTMVFVSEFFYGIAAQRKVELGAKRIAKLIEYTQTNDRMKVDYVAKARELRTELDAAFATLNDTTVHDTLAGAEQQLAAFVGFKQEQKGPITGNYLNLESFYNQLAMRLADHDRPLFVPDEAPLAVDALKAAIEEMETKEKERSEALYKELSRQRMLRELAAEHAKLVASGREWVAPKSADLEAPVDVSSSAQASLELNRLQAVVTEARAVRGALVPQLEQLAAKLEAEHFELLADVQSDSAAAVAAFDALDALADTKRAALADARAREALREQTEMHASEHVAQCARVTSWGERQTAYLSARETVESLADAELVEHQLRAYNVDRVNTHTASVPPVLALGETIRAAKHSGLTEWVFPDAEATVGAREAAVAALFASLDELYTAKLGIAEDHVKREQSKQSALLDANQHVNTAGAYLAFAKEREEALQRKDEVDSVAGAQKAQFELEASNSEAKDIVLGGLPALKALGERVRAAAYTSELSSWAYETPDEVTAREVELTELLERLDALAAAKLAVLVDDERRERFRDDVALRVANHESDAGRLQAWVDESRAYLDVSPEDEAAPVSSMADTERALAQLDAWQAKKRDETRSLQALERLGAGIREARFQSEHNEWVFPEPEKLQERETGFSTALAELDTLAATKRQVLEALRGRETFKEDVALLDAQHTANSDAMLEWTAEKKAYLLRKETVESTADARQHKGALEAFTGERQEKLDGSFAALQAFGARLTARTYASELFPAVFENHEALAAREAALTAAFAELAELAAQKVLVLDDDHARESRRETSMLQVDTHEKNAADLAKWQAETQAYFEGAETIEDSSAAQRCLNELRSTLSRALNQRDAAFGALQDLGRRVVDSAVYESPLSQWRLEPAAGEALAAREAALAEGFATLDSLGEKKKLILEDARDREEFKDKTTLLNEQHLAKAGKLDQWCEKKEEYLRTKDPAASVVDAQVKLNDFAQYQHELSLQQSNSVPSLQSLGQNVRSRAYSTELSSWALSDDGKQAVSDREAALATRIAAMDALAAEKRLWLEDDLAREQIAEQVRLLDKQHAASFEAVQTWSSEAQASLEAEPVISSVLDAEIALRGVDAFHKEREGVAQARVLALQALGKSIFSTTHKSDYSQFECENPDEVRDREAQVESALAALDALAKTRNDRLDVALAEEKQKEQLRFEAASLFSSTARWARSETEKADSTRFGFALDEVEQFAQEADARDAATATTAEEQKAALEAKVAECVASGVTENPYAVESLESVAALQQGVTQALAARKQRLADELQLLRDRDQLCRDFATAAKTFEAKLAALREEVSSSSSPLDERLALAKTRAEEAKAFEDLAQLEALEKKTKDAGVANNPHAFSSHADLVIMMHQYETFLERKAEQLQHEIEHNKWRGLTQDQIDEIDQQFKFFDRDQSGALDVAEVKACLFSLGHDRTKAQVRDIIAQFSPAGSETMDLPAFQAFMISELGVSDTQENIEEAFRMLTKGAPAVKKDDLDDVMQDPDIEYLEKEAPPTEGGLDYAQWTASVFAR